MYSFYDNLHLLLASSSKFTKLLLSILLKKCLCIYWHFLQQHTIHLVTVFSLSILYVFVIPAYSKEFIMTKHFFLKFLEAKKSKGDWPLVNALSLFVSSHGRKHRNVMLTLQFIFSSCFPKRRAIASPVTSLYLLCQLLESLI